MSKNISIRLIHVCCVNLYIFPFGGLIITWVATFLVSTYIW